MGERLAAHEGQAKHGLADVGRAGQAEPGRQRRGHDAEAVERIGADLAVMALDRRGGGGEVVLRQRMHALDEVRAKPHAASAGQGQHPLVDPIRAGHQRDAFGGQL